MCDVKTQALVNIYETQLIKYNIFNVCIKYKKIIIMFYNNILCLLLLVIIIFLMPNVKV